MYTFYQASEEIYFHLEKLCLSSTDLIDLLDMDTPEASLLGITKDLVHQMKIVEIRKHCVCKGVQ